MFLVFDSLAGDYPSLLNRSHLENCMIRQFFYKDDYYVRVVNPLHYVITDDKALKPNTERVKMTTGIDLPNIFPENAVSRLVEHDVYRNENSFPIREEIKMCKGISPPQIHTCVEIDPSLGPKAYKFDSPGRSLVLAFATALGQARFNHGSEVSGVLDKPITVNFISTNGQDFLVTVFQLNTVDTNSNVKNIVWQEQLGNVFETCDYVKAVPQVIGYNQEVVKKILAVYLQNT